MRPETALPAPGKGSLDLQVDAGHTKPTGPGFPHTLAPPQTQPLAGKQQGVPPGSYLTRGRHAVITSSLTICLTSCEAGRAGPPQRVGRAACHSSGAAGRLRSTEKTVTHPRRQRGAGWGDREATPAAPETSKAALTVMSVCERAGT